MIDVILSTEHITPQWLTDVLRNHNILTSGEVIKLDKGCWTPFLATICKLKIDYSENVQASAPKRLFLKMVHLEQEANNYRGVREIQFYQSMMVDNPSLPIPRCYYAGYAQGKGLNLLLEDLSDSHETLEHEIPPTEHQCYQLMDVLAQIHAYWWESPKLGTELGKVSTSAYLADEFEEDVQMYRAFADYLGDRLLPSRQAIYQKVIDKFLPLKLQRFADQKQITLSHGDAHAWNFLYPINEDDRPVLLDWEAIGVNIGTNDVAYLMAVFWHPARRQLLEKSLLKHYHQQLMTYGVQDYSWEACWNDYRFSIINNLFMPVWWWKHKTPAFLWWHRTERLMMAFEDLNCAELLD